MMNVLRELCCQSSQERTTISDKKKCKMSRNNFSELDSLGHPGHGAGTLRRGALYISAANGNRT